MRREVRREKGMEGGGEESKWGDGESGCLITVGYKSQMYCTIAVLFPRRDPVNAAK